MIKNVFQYISRALMVVVVAVSLVGMPAEHATATSDYGTGFGTSFDTSFDTGFNTGHSDGSLDWLPEPEITFTECTLTVDDDVVYVGDDISLTWETTGFTEVKLNGDTLQNYDGSVTIENLQVTTTYKLEALNEEGARCLSEVTVTCLPPPTPEFCELDITKAVNKTSAAIGDALEYTIDITNIGDADCTQVQMTDQLDEWFGYTNFTYTSSFATGDGTFTEGTNTFTFAAGKMVPGDTGSIVIFGEVLAPTQCGDFEIENQARVTAAELTNAAYSDVVKTTISNSCPNPAPECTLIPDASLIISGATTTLAWTTTNATTATLTGFDAVDLNGEVTVGPLTENTSYTLTATGPGGEVTCPATVEVYTDTPAPSCDLFTISPDTIDEGATSTITWETTNATRVVIDNAIGEVEADGTREIAPLADSTYTMTVFGVDDQKVTCSDAITVTEDPEPEVFSCANNVVFSASDTTITSGQNIVLDWTVTDADPDTVALNGTAVATSASQTISPTADTTYTITASKGDESISCPIPVSVSTGGGGGGGGGSATPRCELDISATRISSGEEIEIEWDTSNARTVILSDDRGEVLFTTEEFLADEKEQFYDGAITLKPTRDTTYTLLVERGSRDRECEVSVEVGGGGGGSNPDPIVVLENRNQEPLVSGIALTQVPYTGFEAGPIVTALFYILLIAWSVFVTYLIVIRNRTTAPVEVFMTSRPTASEENVRAMKQAESVRPDVFVPSMSSATAVPINLPTSDTVVGYDTAMEAHQATDAIVTEIENRAHAQNALLSSDAVRYFIGTTAGEMVRNEALDTVIADAKEHYPLEDGWIVINEARMRQLCETCFTQATASDAAPYIPATVPAGAGSLAEAIVTGNVVAAYEMIGSRPMFALADAAADLDNVYRARKGESVTVSNLLSESTKSLSEEQIKNMCVALTGALDGTYTDEASAVKMAIMKAVKIAG